MGRIGESSGTTGECVEVIASAEAFTEMEALARRIVADWPRDDQTRLLVVLEELFANTVAHGQAGADGKTVRIFLKRAGRGVEVEYSDLGLAFDPRVHGSSRETPPEGPGGIGLWLVAHYARDVAYRRDGERNVTSFRMTPSR